MNNAEIRSCYQKVKQLAFLFYKSNQYIRQTLDVTDLYHEGIIALHRCEHTYKPEFGVSFLTYALHRVRLELIDFLNKQGVVNIPKKPRALLNRYKMVYDEFIKKNSREPEYHEMAKLLNVPIEEIQTILNFDIHYSEMQDHIPDKKLNQQERIMVMNDINECLNRLSDTEKLIFISIELEDIKSKDLQKQLNLSKNTVTNKKNNAKKRILKCLKNKGWESMPDLK